MANFKETYLNLEQVNWDNLWVAAQETIYMTIISMIFVFIFGFLLGLLLFTIGRKKDRGSRIIYSMISVVSNIFRSIPYIILLILLVPFAKAIVGTGIGAKAVIPSLVVSAIPLYARLVEVAFREVDAGVLEAADAMGAKPWEKIIKVLFRESLPAILSGLTITTVTMVGYTAMGGVVGGGGLGGLAYQEGFARNNQTVTLIGTVFILIIVFVIQIIGDILVKKVDKR